jgi:hypothetical protein
MAPSAWRSGVLVIAVAPASMVCWSAESSTLECQDLFQCLGSWNNHEQPMNLVQALVWQDKNNDLLWFLLSLPADIRRTPLLSGSTQKMSFPIGGPMTLPLWSSLGHRITQLPAFWLFIPRIPCICSPADSLVSDSPVLARHNEHCKTKRLNVPNFYGTLFLLFVFATLVSLVVVFNAKYNGHTTKRSSRRLLRLPAY